MPQKVHTRWETLPREDLRELPAMVTAGWEPVFSLADRQAGRVEPMNVPHDGVEYTKDGKLLRPLVRNTNLGLEQYWRLFDGRAKRDYATLAEARDAETVPAPITATIAIGNEDLASWLVTAYEGGSNYWAEWGTVAKPAQPAPGLEDYPAWIADVLGGGEVEILDAETGDPLGEINRANIQRGINAMRDDYREDLVDLLSESSWDAGTADVFLQLVVLGEITFG